MFGHAVMIIKLVRPVLSDGDSIGALLIKEDLEPQYGYSDPDQAEELQGLISAADVFAYYEEADLGYFRKMGGIPQTRINVKKLAMILFPREGNYRLYQLAEKLGIAKSENELDLISGILQKCEEKGRTFDLTFFSETADWLDHPELACFFQMLKSAVLKDYPDRPLRVIDQNDFPEEGLFYQPRKEQILEDKNWVLECFRQDGLLAAAMPGYESRDLQVEMAGKVIDGFLQSRNTVIEAGTGTGKSIAYLLPAVWWARKNQQKVVVATHTIPLQTQLDQKDLPFLHKILPFSFRGCVLKGKGNYYCRRNDQLERQKRTHFTGEEKTAFLSLFVWRLETRTGDLSELPQQPGMTSVWSSLGADSLCEPGRCPYAKSCYLLMARRRAEKADLIIINHSLLFSDVKTDNQIIPEYSYLIIDEAHNLYQTAISQLGFELSARSIDWLLNGIAGTGRLSLVAALTGLLRGEQFNLNGSELRDKIQSVSQSCLSLHEQSAELFSFFASVMGNQNGIILEEAYVGSEDLSFFYVGLENYLERFRTLKMVLESINKLLFSDNDQISTIKYDMIKNIVELGEMIKGLEDILKQDRQGRVTYLEKNNGIYLKHSCIDVSSIIRERILEKNASTVLTSATLSVNGNFDYFTKDIGLTENFQTVIYHSPFDYKENVTFCIVKGLDVSSAPGSLMAGEIAGFIGRAAALLKGRTLVLFTSYQLMQHVYHQSEHWAAAEGLDLLAQGINGRRESILRSFMENPRSVLMGTNSFWEGIDVPGEKLSCVIIVKLPFMSPSMPLVQARSNKLEEEGRNPFIELLLPEAVIRFRQGFGRLIRSGTDSGVMILLDDRVLKKYYGRYFLDALPIEQYFTGRSEEVLAKMNKLVAE